MNSCHSRTRQNEEIREGNRGVDKRVRKGGKKTDIKKENEKDGEGKGEGERK